MVRNESGDPIIIGYCAACGYPIYDHEEYYETDDGEKIHAEGVGARAKIIDTNLSFNLSCVLLHLQREYMEDEAAKLFGFERRKA